MPVNFNVMDATEKGAATGARAVAVLDFNFKCKTFRSPRSRSSLVFAAATLSAGTRWWTGISNVHNVFVKLNL